ncbi:MAG: DNA-processing protein DprA [Candidatus Poribacteria bacterium]|nr:DNA-processing protein DprA [Candidatus Poribacteria bacterium]
MLSDEVESLIHLNLMQGVDSKTVQQLVNIFGSAVEALKTSSEDIQAELRKVGVTAPPGLVQRLLHYELNRELELIHRHGCSIITLYDEEYPPLLKNIETPPPVLYVKGELKPEDARSISIVGPRKSKNYGVQVSFKLGSELAEKGLTVVSGLAKGIDGCAHRGALDVGGRTIAVLGNGLSHVYPPEHRELSEEIRQSGALISEFPMNIGPESKNFPKRNRIISGLTLGTVVVEAPVRSGSLITAEHAHKQGRKVFAVPDRILSGHSSGCHKLIKNGAMLIDSTDDLLESLSQDIPDIRPDKQPTIKEPAEQEYLFELPSVPPSEVIVENAVVEYFETKFGKFTVELQREIQMGSYKGRADVVLIDGKNLVVIVECKRIGYIGTGVEQLQSYLSVTETRFGIFTNSEQPDEWAFYKRQGRNNFKQISRSEFEREVASNINTKKS